MQKELSPEKKFREIIQFLTQDPQRVISLLKKKRKFVGKWFRDYFGNVTQIWSRAYIHFVDNIKYDCQDWINDYLGLVDRITDCCDSYDKENMKCTCSSPDKCRDKYNNIFEILCSNCMGKGKACQNNIFRLIVQRFQTSGSNRSFLTSNNLFYNTRCTFGTMSTNPHVNLSKKDDQNNTDYYSGYLKRTKSSFPLLRVTFQNIDRGCYNSTFRDKLCHYYTVFFDDVISHGQNIRDFELYIFEVASLYYLFFWDVLNSTILKDTPDNYTRVVSTSNLEEPKLIASGRAIIENRIIDSEDFLDDVPEEYDIHYHEKYSHIFQHEEITGQDCFNFLDAIASLLDISGIRKSSEISPYYRKKILNYVKYKIFITNRIIVSSNMTSASRIAFLDRDIEDRFHRYKTFLSLYSTVTSVINTRVRNRKSYFNENILLQFCREVKNGISQKDAYETVVRIEGISYSYWNELLNKWKEYHPQYHIKKVQNLRESKVKMLLKNSTDNDLYKWVKNIKISMPQ